MLTKMVDGSWIDLRLVQHIAILTHAEDGTLKGSPLVKILLADGEMSFLSDDPHPLVDELATKINAERSPALVDQVHTLTWALHEIRDHLSAIESNNPNVKERVNGCINIARKALKEET